MDDNLAAQHHLQTVFSNEAIPLESLPQFQSVDLNPLHQDYKKVMSWSIFFTSIIMLLVLGSIGYFTIGFSVYYFLFFLPWLIWFMIRILSFKISFSNQAYTLREKDFIYQEGWLFKSQQIVPYSKIQHLSIQEGWIARKYGLANINIFTTGDNIVIPGVSKEIAMQIQAYILSKIQLEDEVKENANTTISNSNEESIDTTSEA